MPSEFGLSRVVHRCVERWNERCLLTDEKEGYQTRRVVFQLPFSAADNVFQTGQSNCDKEITVSLELEPFEPIIDCPLRRQLLSRQTNAFDWLRPQPMNVVPMRDWLTLSVRASDANCSDSFISKLPFLFLDPGQTYSENVDLSKMVINQ